VCKCTDRKVSATEYATLQSACGFTNSHIKIHENSLEYPGVIDTKSDQMNEN